MRTSRVLEKLRRNEIALMTSVSSACSSRMSELAGLMGFDAVWIDMEHRPLGTRDIFHLIQGTRASDVDACVRVRSREATAFSRPLEDGAAGVMLPRCNNAEEAEYAVRYSRFAPLGERGFDNAGPDADYGLIGTDYFEQANKETFIVVQIETTDGVQNVDAIAAVPGIDILFIGRNDLNEALGLRMQVDHPRITKIIEDVVRAAERHNIHVGCSVQSPAAAAPLIDLGVRFINCGSDQRILVNGWNDVITEFEHLHGWCRNQIGRRRDKVSSSQVADTTPPGQLRQPVQ